MFTTIPQSEVLDPEEDELEEPDEEQEPVTAPEPETLPEEPDLGPGAQS